MVSSLFGNEMIGALCLDGRYGINCLFDVLLDADGHLRRERSSLTSPDGTRLSKEHVTRTARTGQLPRVLVAL
jgi:hypothetical protein